MRVLKYLLLFFLVVSFKTKAQQKIDTVFFDKAWQKTSRKHAAYYRIVEKQNEGDYLVRNFHSNGKPQMIARSIRKDSIIFNGICTTYNESGYRESIVNYVNGKAVGSWTEFIDNEVDSNIIERISENSCKYIRFSKRDSIRFKGQRIVVETMPEFPGGNTAMMNFLKKNIKYPVEERYLGKQGKCYIKFVLDTLGKVEEATVLRTSGYSALDSEAVRVVYLMPKWSPGKQNDIPVRVYFNLPVNFQAEWYGINITKDELSKIFFREGKIEYKKGNYIEASKLLIKSVKNRSNHKAYVLLGLVYEKQNKMDDAYNNWKKAKEMGSIKAVRLLKKKCGNRL